MGCVVASNGKVHISELSTYPHISITSVVPDFDTDTYYVKAEHAEADYNLNKQASQTNSQQLGYCLVAWIT